MSEVIWENPPSGAPKAPRPSKHDELAAALRRRPGRWAVFSEAASNSTVSSINRGKLTAFRPAGDYEAASVSNGDGRVKVWVRFVGTKSNRAQHLAAIRAWARTAGWFVNERGRIPAQIIDAYDQAHQDVSA